MRENSRVPRRGPPRESLAVGRRLDLADVALRRVRQRLGHLVHVQIDRAALGRRPELVGLDEGPSQELTVREPLDRARPIHVLALPERNRVVVLGHVREHLLVQFSARRREVRRLGLGVRVLRAQPARVVRRCLVLFVVVWHRVWKAVKSNTSLAVLGIQIEHLGLLSLVVAYPKVRVHARPRWIHRVRAAILAGDRA